MPAAGAGSNGELFYPDIWIYPADAPKWIRNQSEPAHAITTVETGR